MKSRYFFLFLKWKDILMELREEEAEKKISIITSLYQREKTKIIWGANWIFCLDNIKNNKKKKFNE